MPGETPTEEIDPKTFAVTEAATAEGSDSTATATADSPIRTTAAHMARSLCLSFIHHESRDYHGTIDALYETDRQQFAHLSDEKAREAATHLTDALWAKDAAEAPYEDEDGIVDESFAEASLAPVEAPLRKRGELVGMDDPAEYARQTAEGWRKHKIGGDYWSHMMRGQWQEVRAAMGNDTSYPAKDKHGQSGFGPLPARYIVGVELHDMRTERHWERAVDVMTGYYEEILNAHDD